jgi:hypothetical protein
MDWLIQNLSLFRTDLESIDNQLFIHNLKIVKVVTLSITHSLVIPKESFVPRFVIPKESFVPTE